MKPIRWVMRILLVLLVLCIFFGSLLILLANPEEVGFTSLVYGKPLEAALGQWLVCFFLAGVVLGGLFGFIAGRMLLYRKRERKKIKKQLENSTQLAKA